MECHTNILKNVTQTYYTYCMKRLSTHTDYEMINDDIAFHTMLPTRQNNKRKMINNERIKQKENKTKLERFRRCSP